MLHYREAGTRDDVSTHITGTPSPCLPAMHRTRGVRRSELYAFSQVEGGCQGSAWVLRSGLQPHQHRLECFLRWGAMCHPLLIESESSISPPCPGLRWEKCTPFPVELAGPMTCCECGRPVSLLFCSENSNVQERGVTVSLGPRTKAGWTKAIASWQWTRRTDKKCTCVALRH